MKDKDVQSSPSDSVTTITNNTLSLTSSNNSSLRSYTSSLADSTMTSKSNRSIGAKFKRALTRKRAESLKSPTTLSFGEQQQQHQHQQSQSQSPQVSAQRSKSLRNRSLSSLLPPSLMTSSQNSTRDNSIASLSDFEMDSSLPPSPLQKIDENSKGVFPSHVENVRKQRLLVTTTKISDEKLFDHIADDILSKVAHEDSVIEWRI